MLITHAHLDHVPDIPVDLANHPVVPAGDLNIRLETLRHIERAQRGGTVEMRVCSGAAGGVGLRQQLKHLVRTLESAWTQTTA